MDIIFADLLTSTLMTRLAVFGCAAAGAWWILDYFATRKPRAEQRLDDIREPNTRKSDLLTDSKSKSGAMSKVLEKASPALAKPLLPKTTEEVSKTKDKLNQAGFRGENAPEMYWSLKMMGLVIGFVLGGGTVILTRGFNADSMTYSAIIAGVAFFLPEIIIWLLTKSRKDNIFYGLPDALDLMVVCVESGLGLDQAMRKVAEEMKKTYRVIAEEFSLCNLQLQMGVPETMFCTISVPEQELKT